MAAPTEANVAINCEDFALFQDALRRLRMIDDRVINALNSSLPTESFRNSRDPEQTCKEFYEQLHSAHLSRDRMIRTCVRKVSETVGELRRRNEVSADADKSDATRQLRKEQSKLRLMQAELSVEEVVRDRSLKVFYERCRLVHLPPGFQLS